MMLRVWCRQKRGAGGLPVGEYPRTSCLFLRGPAHELLQNLQKLFDTQVTRLEEERTAQSPSGAMFVANLPSPF